MRADGRLPGCMPPTRARPRLWTLCKFSSPAIDICVRPQALSLVNGHQRDRLGRICLYLLAHPSVYALLSFPLPAQFGSRKQRRAKFYRLSVRDSRGNGLRAGLAERRHSWKMKGWRKQEPMVSLPITFCSGSCLGSGRLSSMTLAAPGQGRCGSSLP